MVLDLNIHIHIDQYANVIYVMEWPGDDTTLGEIFCPKIIFIFCLAQQPPSGPGHPHSRGFYITQNDAPQLVGFLWTSDQPDAESYT